MSHVRSRQFTHFPANPNTQFKKKNSESAGSPSQCKRICGGWAVLVALGLIALQFGATSSSEGQVLESFPFLASSVQGPISLDADAVEDLIDDLIEDLDIAAQIATAHATPLSSQEQQNLDARLDHSEALINQVFDPAVAPNLTPSDAGTISLLYSPITLADYAEQCVDLAQDAKDELLMYGNSSSDVLIGTKLKTIRYLISRSSPHNYRTKAGIN